MTDPERTDRELAPEQLRALLEDAVTDVQPAPALDRIRSRTKVTPMRHTRPWVLVAAGAVAATAATVTAVALADGLVDRSDSGPGPAATSTGDPTGTAGPSDDPTPTPTGSPDGSPPAQPAPSGDSSAVPVYLVGDTPVGPRLFREFQPVPAGTGSEQSARLLAALDAAISGEASDPDYRSGWPAGSSVVGAGVDPAGSAAGSAVQITLSTAQDLSQRPGGMGEDDARVAVQQLVYTAQAVVQERTPITFTGEDGAPLDTLLGVDVSEPHREAPASEVQAPVWITSPQDGQQVGRAFTVEGRGAFFEANVSWQLLRDGAVVEEGFATARECCTLAPYSFEVRAAPGSYVLRVYDADMSGGEGVGEQEDTKRVTVR